VLSRKFSQVQKDDIGFFLKDIDFNISRRDVGENSPPLR